MFAVPLVDGRKARCIYCDGEGPFNEEHVFPAGLGGDDRAFVLQGCVCESCNSAFSKLETKFMRSSPEALSRVFFNVPGRARGRTCSTPRLEIPSASYVDPDSNVGHQIEISAGGSAKLLPQIAFLDTLKGELRITGSVKQELKEFLESLPKTLGEETLLVQKLSTTSFAVTTLRWEGSGYVEWQTETHAKPPGRCIWLERFLAPVENESVVSRRSLLLMRPRGQLALRLLGADVAAQCLSLARKAGTEATQEALRDAVETDVDKPSVTLRLSIDEPAWIRVQLKIGANLAHHVFGSAIDTPDMQSLRRYVRFGGELRSFNIEEDPNFLAILNSIEGENHLMLLATVPIPNSDRCALVFGLRLFHAAYIQASLAEDLPLTACREPRVFCVRYRENRIEEFTMQNLIQRMVAARLK